MTTINAMKHDMENTMKTSGFLRLFLSTKTFRRFNVYFLRDCLWNFFLILYIWLRSLICISSFVHYNFGLFIYIQFEFEITILSAFYPASVTIAVFIRERSTRWVLGFPYFFFLFI